MGAYLSLSRSGRRGGVGVFAYSRLGAYSRWALIRVWAPIRINTVILCPCRWYRRITRI